MLISSSEKFFELAKQLSAHCQPIATKNGRYLRWSSHSGAEAWLQVDRRGELIGMNPHFSGSSRVKVGLNARITRANSTELDGAFHAWADPPGEDPATGSYPFVFDVPDFQCYREAGIPGVAEAQIAAFAHEITVYGSIEAYDASDTSKPRFASKSFIPSGLFSPDLEKTEPPEANAIFTGHVRQAEKRTNDLTGKPFYWLDVETLGGVFDVVIDFSLMDEIPTVGGVVSGSFWLSGRLIAYPRKEGVLRRFFGKKKGR
jgi:hypothetical protein